MMNKIKTAVFPVGGLGTRFLPATKAMPKEMLPIIDKPLIQYAVEEAIEAGIERFIFVTGRGKTAIEDHFDHSFELTEILKQRTKSAEISALQTCNLHPGQVAYIRQQEPLGLGHAVWCARHYIQEPFAVILADDLIKAEKGCLSQMCEAYTGGHMVAAMDVPKELTHRYGILKVMRDNGRLVHAGDIVEKPLHGESPSLTAVIGRYILDPSVLSELEKQTIGKGGEIQLTDALRPLAQDNQLTGYRFEGMRFDCGAKDEFMLAALVYALEREDIAPTLKNYLMEHGVKACA